MATTRSTDPNRIHLEYDSISDRDQASIGDYLTYRSRVEHADDATLNTELVELVRAAHLVDGDLVDADPERFGDESPAAARSLDRFFAYDGRPR